MTTYTTTQLATEVMRLPGWLEGDETPDTSDAALITNVYSGFFAEWNIREKTYWDKEAIPEEVFWHIVRIVADSVAPSFGDAAPTEIDIETGQPVSMGVKGWRAFNRVKGRPPTGFPAAASTSYY